MARLAENTMMDAPPTRISLELVILMLFACSARGNWRKLKERRHSGFFILETLSEKLHNLVKSMDAC